MDYEALIEALPVGLALCQMDGKFILVNGAFADIVGRDKEKLIGMTYWEITPKRFHDKGEQEHLDKLNENESYGPYKKKYEHANGDEESNMFPATHSSLSETPNSTA